MADSEENVRYRFSADATLVLSESARVYQALDRIDKLTEMMARTDRNEMIASRDALAAKKLAATEAADQLNLLDKKVNESASNQIIEAKRAAAAQLETMRSMLSAQKSMIIAARDKELEIATAAANAQRVILENLATKQAILNSKIREYGAAVETSLAIADAARTREDSLIVQGLKDTQAFTAAEAVRREAIEATVAAETLLLAAQEKSAKIAILSASERTKMTPLVAAETAAAEAIAKTESQFKDRAAVVEEQSRNGLARELDSIRVSQQAYKNLSDDQQSGFRQIAKESAYTSQQIVQHFHDQERAAVSLHRVLLDVTRGVQSLGQFAQQAGYGLLFTVTAPLAYLIKMGIDFDILKENATNAFTVMLKDGDKAKQVMDELFKVTKPTALQFQSVVAAAAKLQLQNFGADQIVPIITRLEKLAQLAQVEGKNPDLILSQATDVIAKIQTRQSLTRQTLTSLNLALGFQPDLLKAYGLDQTKAGIDKLYEGLKTRSLDAQTVLTVLFDTIDKKTGDIQARAARSLSGLIANMKDTLKQALGDIVLPLFESLKRLLDDLIPKVERMGEAFKRLSPQQQDLIVKSALIAVALGPFLIAIGASVRGMASLLSIATGVYGVTQKIRLEGLAGLGSSGATAEKALSGISAAAPEAGAAALAGSLTATTAAGEGAAASVASVGAAAAETGGILSGVAAGPILLAFVPALALMADVAVLKWTDIKAGFTAGWTFLLELNKREGDVLGKSLDGPVAQIESKFDALQTFISDRAQVFVEFISSRWDAFKSQTLAVFDAVFSATGGFIDAVTAKLYEIGKVAPIFSDTWDVIKNGVDTFTGVVLTAVQFFIDLLHGNVDKAISDIARLIGIWLGGLFRWLFGYLKVAFDALLILFGSIAEGVIAILTRGIPALIEVVGRVISAVWNAFKDGGEALARNIADWFKHVGEHAGDAFVEGLHGQLQKQEFTATNIQFQGAQAGATASVVPGAAAPPGVPGFDTHVGEIPEKAKAAKDQVDKLAVSLAELDKQLQNLQSQFGTNAPGGGFEEFSRRVKDSNTAVADFNSQLQSALERGDSVSTLTGHFADWGKELNKDTDAIAAFAHGFAQLHGAGEFQQKLFEADSERQAKLKEADDRYTAAYLSKHKGAEGELVQYKSDLDQIYQIKVLGVYDQMFQHERQIARKIRDVRFQDVDQEAEHRLLKMYEEVNDFRDAEQRKWNGSREAQVRIAGEVDSYQTALQEAHLRWYERKELDLQERLKSAQVAAYGGVAEKRAHDLEVAVETERRAISNLSGFNVILNAKAAGELNQYKLALLREYYKEDERLLQDRALKQRQLDVQGIYDARRRFEAEKELAGFQAAQAAHQAPRFGDPTKQLAEEMARSTEAMRQVQQTYDQELSNDLKKLLDDGTRTAGDLQKIFDSVKFTDLLKRLGDAHIPVAALSQAAKDANGSFDKFYATAVKLLNFLQSNKSLTNFQKQVKALGDTFRSVFQDQLARVASAVGDAFAQWALGAESLGRALKKAMLGALGDIATYWGEFMIKLGIANLFTPGMHAWGVAEIAAGIALVALGGILKGLSGSGASAGASSGGSGGAGTPATQQPRPIQQLPFNTSGQGQVVVTFDTGNMNRAMSQFFEGAAAHTLDSAGRRTRVRTVRQNR